MFKAFTAGALAALASLAAAQDGSGAAEAHTCLDKDFTPVGYARGGEAYSDWDYLVAHESSEYTYRLTGVQLCTDMEGNFRGMEAFVGRYSTHSSGRLLGTLAMSKIGDVSGVCKTVRVNPLRGEYISQIVLRFGADFIDAISVGASTGARVFAGNHPSSFQDKVLTFGAEEPLVGFFGSADEQRIYSVGQVLVQAGCSVADNDGGVVPLEDTAAYGYGSNNQALAQWHQHTGLDLQSTIYVAAATTLIVVLALALCVGVAVHLRRKNKATQLVMHRESIRQTAGGPGSSPAGARQRQQSIKRVNGKTEIHDAVAQHPATDIELADDFESGRAAKMQAAAKHQAADVYTEGTDGIGSPHGNSK